MMSSNIKVSIIIPVYNVEKYLERCLNSVLNQSMKDTEIICIDDCSADTSLDILKCYEKENKNIKVIQLKDNKGLSYVRNEGIKEANGEYVWFIDSDDYITSEDSLEQLYNEANHEDLDIIMFSAQYKYEDKELEDCFSSAECDRQSASNTDVMTGSDLFSYLIKRNEFISCVPFCFFKNEFLKNSGLWFESMIHEDLVFAPLITVLAKKSKYVNQKYYTYYKRRGSITTEEDCSKSFMMYLDAISIIMNTISNRIKEPKVLNAMSMYINKLKEKAFDLYFRVMIQGNSIVFLKGDSFFVWKMMFDSRYPIISEKVNDTFFSLIKKAKHIIIYGAGKISKTVQRLLDDLNIDYNIAITQKGDSSYSEINDYLNVKKECLVLIASIKYAEEMFKITKDYEYEHIYLMV